jgi:hypothetical protein
MLALGKTMTYHILPMRPTALLIVSLLFMVIAAPVVDAVACDDCKDIVPVRDMRQCSIQGQDHSGCGLPTHDAGRPEQQENGTAQDLCPVCANTAAAMSNACCGAPNILSHTHHLPELMAFSDPTYSISKPPQN